MHSGTSFACWWLHEACHFHDIGLRQAVERLGCCSGGGDCLVESSLAILASSWAYSSLVFLISLMFGGFFFVLLVVFFLFRPPFS